MDFKPVPMYKSQRAFDHGWSSREFDHTSDKSYDRSVVGALLIQLESRYPHVRPPHRKRMVRAMGEGRWANQRSNGRGWGRTDEQLEQSDGADGK